ncbi:MAG: glycoside hydrolase family 16 protein, partial [Croceimicrobium sp.]
NIGVHPMRLHLDRGSASIKSIKFSLIKSHQQTQNILYQNMAGEEWELVWSDEFDGEGLPDTSKWSYNIGDWGWGNNEPQYYTENKVKNARQENGHLIIEAHRNDDGHDWTSARLTTQGKYAFTYGKIEFRAMVPEGRGTWAAGWLLGNDYRDEISWPYCGEIDVLETVGYEIDDSTGSGLNHATCHTRAYYFKQGNQIGSEIAVDSMNTKFHTYEVRWYPDRIEAYLDGEYYFTYDKNANDLEWPFHNAQNIIVNLAVGGGWGGAKGIDPNYDSHQYILDYVRVYQAKVQE